MKKIYILSAIVLFAVATAGIASAGFVKFNHGPRCFEQKINDSDGFKQMIERKAEILGIDASEIQSKLDEGKSMKEIMEESGITQETMFAKRKEYMESYLEKLVSEGKMTQDQADQRLEKIDQMPHKGFRGFGR